MKTFSYSMLGTRTNEEGKMEISHIAGITRAPSEEELRKILLRDTLPSWNFSFLITEVCEENLTCTNCAGHHAVEGCPNPNEGTIGIVLWPPHPSPESWYTDTPNEGFIWSPTDSGWELSDVYADYHGCILWTSTEGYEIPPYLGSRIQETYWDSFKPTPEYKAACALVEEVLPSCKTVEEVEVRFIQTLKEMGWREIEADHGDSDRMYKWKEEPEGWVYPENPTEEKEEE